MDKTFEEAKEELIDIIYTELKIKILVEKLDKVIRWGLFIYKIIGQIRS